MEASTEYVTPHMPARVGCKGGREGKKLQCFRERSRYGVECVRVRGGGGRKRERYGPISRKHEAINQLSCPLLPRYFHTQNTPCPLLLGLSGVFGCGPAPWSERTLGYLIFTFSEFSFGVNAPHCFDFLNIKYNVIVLFCESLTI